MVMWFVPLVRRRVAALSGLRVTSVPGRDRSTAWYDRVGSDYVASRIDWDAPRWWAGAAEVARLCHEIGHAKAARTLPPILVEAKTALASGSIPSAAGGAAILADEIRAWEEGMVVARALGVTAGEYLKEWQKCISTFIVADLYRRGLLPPDVRHLMGWNT